MVVCEWAKQETDMTSIEETLLIAFLHDGINALEAELIRELPDLLQRPEAQTFMQKRLALEVYFYDRCDAYRKMSKRELEALYGAVEGKLNDELTPEQLMDRDAMEAVLDL